RLIFVFFLVCGLAAAQAPANSAAPATVLPSESTVDSFMQQTFGYEPDVSWKIASIKPAPVPGLAEVNVILASQQGQQSSRFYVTADGQHAVIGEIIPFGAKPFAATNKILEQGVSGPSRGPKNAPVTIVEFGDLQCPACKEAQPKIEGLVASEPNARFVFESFPLPMHNWALKGAAYADCVAKASNEAFWKFIGTVYADQENITAENVDQKLTTIATDSGVKGPEIAACAATPKAKADVDASIALGKEVNVTGTPTLYINGRSIGNVGNVPEASLKALVDFAAKQAQ
ncbi:MAG TPA: thioredoxin domain-containing protein, partial [Candidatus Aquilonibacter sp.]|nr:thioredoxin domain-containing protein [Candidatus Aquilonibacter sp.]